MGRYAFFREPESVSCLMSRLRFLDLAIRDIVSQSDLLSSNANLDASVT